MNSQAGSFNGKREEDFLGVLHPRTMSQCIHKTLSCRLNVLTPPTLVCKMENKLEHKAN
jgi:hypothetical protein